MKSICCTCVHWNEASGQSFVCREHCEVLISMKLDLILQCLSTKLLAKEYLSSTFDN